MFNLYRVQYHKRRKGSAPMEPVTVFVVAPSETAASNHITGKFDPEVDEVTVYAVQSEKNNVQIAEEPQAQSSTPLAGGVFGERGPVGLVGFDDSAYAESEESHG